MNYIPYESNSTEYMSVHYEIRAARGSAATFLCVICSRQALDWAWIHDTDPADIESYNPLCRPCHRNYDYTSEWRENVSRSLFESWTTERKEKIWTPEKRKEQAEKMRGNTYGKGNKGKIHTLEQNIKNSEAKRGKKSPEHSEIYER